MCWLRRGLRLCHAANILLSLAACCEITLAEDEDDPDWVSSVRADDPVDRDLVSAVRSDETDRHYPDPDDREQWAKASDLRKARASSSTPSAVTVVPVPT